MAVKIGSARINEKGKTTGGTPGDQTKGEVSTQNWYLHSKGWVVIRAKDEATREKIAYAMEAACANEKIGYGQDNRMGLFNAVKNKGYDPAKCSEKVNTDCSETVRVCVHHAGVVCKDFNTANEAAVLKATGLFDIITDESYTKKSTNLLRGDILVTATKGHTVVVLSNGSKTKPSNLFQVKVNCGSLYVRKGPGTNYATAGVVRKDEKYNILETNENGKWGRIEENGKKGWISLAFTLRI